MEHLWLWGNKVIFKFYNRHILLTGYEDWGTLQNLKWLITEHDSLKFVLKISVKNPKSFRLLTNAFQVWSDEISSRIILRWIYSLEYVYTNQLFLYSCSSHLAMKFDTRSREDPVSLWRMANAGNVRLYCCMSAWIIESVRQDTLFKS